MVISIFFTSSGVSRRPRFGEDCAVQTPDIRKHAAATNTTDLDVNIFHRPVSIDSPALNAVEVIRLARRILCDPFGARGLDFALFIRGPAHQNGAPSVPLPGQPKSR